MSTFKKTRLLTALVAGGFVFGGGTAVGQSISPAEVSASGGGIGEPLSQWGS
jgi:hypothetical protein